MPAGSYWSEEFVRQLGESEMRHAYMADQTRTRIALQIKALRDQAERRWSQTELGRRSGKPQNVISRIENPDYGQLTLQTLFDIASAYQLPVYVDFPEWEDWLLRMKDMDPKSLHRQSFDVERLTTIARAQCAKAEDIGNGALLEFSKANAEQRKPQTSALDGISKIDKSAGSALAQDQAA
jgi:transcriptional regulator with XRE-family HTH domain